MSKLWIVHRNPRRRDALARLCGLEAPELVCDGPTGDGFADASAPAAILIGLEGDLELELDFLHRHRQRLDRTRRILLTRPEDAAEVQRLFAASPEEILDRPPSDRTLRALVLSAVAHRNAESLAERRDRERIAQRFASWLGGIEVPGLLRALDPSLSALPLLVRGVPGSGRALLARYVELFRGARGPTLRLHARELRQTDDVTDRLRARSRSGEAPIRTIWIDEIDALPSSIQLGLAEWIRFDSAPSGAVDGSLRWIATAGPGDGLEDRLQADLERAFAPLELTLPALADHPETLADFAARIAEDWSESVGDVARRVGESAIAALEAHAWAGDRAAVEAILRTTFATTARNPIEEGDLTLVYSGGVPVESTPVGTPETSIEEATYAPPESVEADEASFAVVDAEPDFVDSLAPPPSRPLAHDEEAESATSASEPDSPSESVDDFERAFLEGLPAESRTHSPETAASTPDGHELPDQSVKLSEESFASASGTPHAGRSVTDTDQSWRRLARSLSHEIRNPLVSIRTFTELLPEHFEDAAFRERFTDLVGRDVAHIDEVISRLASAAEREKLEAAPVDVSALLEQLLDERRERIGQGRLLVLRELEREAPIAWADPHALEVALAGLLDRALAALPERGDLFVATRRIERAADGDPRLRILLRHHHPELGSRDGSGLEELGSAANVLEYVLAETVVEASGGTLTIDSTDAHETLILVDLRTPA